ncbi:hypothetical protein SMSP2_02891 [Limihaloglobus sulfuriphilus]|uniref:DUF642 domain-containing protein n=1 Tax=Limihaloglobus sulfuriphilus TaxID=1851148 RepID=A0A1Q2MIG8_9BACT|nr:DUF642 domain-containing protein [Limihaloglobus sulfuriphilus]AQQ72505.1 hypothetical protein SMSP2_02891 [Limihaloglobus sulfuriphilus]
MTCKKSLIITLALVLFTMSANSALILDDSFESPVITPDPSLTFLKLYDTGETFGSWLVVSGDIEVANDTYGGFAAYDGDQRIALNGTVPGKIGTELATAAGQEYTVSFYIYNNNDVTVGFAGASDDAYIDSDIFNAGSSSWQEQTWNFTAQGASTWLFFEGDATSANSGPSLDMVTVVPEPATMAILILGGIGMRSMRRFR